jgi:multiple sugar transport system substrate-binding protein
LPANPADAEFKTAWQDAVNRVLNGQQTPQEAMDQAQEEAQAALDAAWANAETDG